MGTDPSTSVAGPTGELHDTKGVWIGDASAFPTASGTNPMITIMGARPPNAQSTSRRPPAAATATPPSRRPEHDGHDNRAATIDRSELYIGGEWVTPAAGRLKVINSTTEERDGSSRRARRRTSTARSRPPGTRSRLDAARAEERAEACGAIGAGLRARRRSSRR